jgi:hypothetical protein
MDEESLAKKLPEPFPGAKAEPALMAALLQVARGKMPQFEYDLEYNSRQYSLSVHSPGNGYFVLIVKSCHRINYAKPYRKLAK